MSAIVIAQRARMELHDESILRGHARHLHEHVRFEATLIVARVAVVWRAFWKSRSISSGSRSVYGSTTA